MGLRFEVIWGSHMYLISSIKKRVEEKLFFIPECMVTAELLEWNLI
jgi:hypothetical protein